MSATAEAIGTDRQGRTTRTIEGRDDRAEIIEMTKEEVAEGWPNYVVRFEYDFCIYYADTLTQARTIAKEGLQ